MGNLVDNLVENLVGNLVLQPLGTDIEVVASVGLVRA